MAGSDEKGEKSRKLERQGSRGMEKGQGMRELRGRKKGGEVQADRQEE